MVSKYRDILEPPAEIQQHQRNSPVMPRTTPTQGKVHFHFHISIFMTTQEQKKIH